MLHGGVFPGRVERGLSDADRSAKASHRDRAPLVRRQFSLLSGDQRIQQTIAQSEIFRFEIGGFGRGYRAGNGGIGEDRKSTRLNSSHAHISYAVFCFEKKKK